MELIKGCRSKKEIESITKKFGSFDLWLSKALRISITKFCQITPKQGTGNY
ncbi:MAG: hypothetical protein IPH52_24435 [Leptospiraceae bacterium]|nr:hypothetical protein [Leptospiraceae bacterium]